MKHFFIARRRFYDKKRHLFWLKCLHQTIQPNDGDDRGSLRQIIFFACKMPNAFIFLLCETGRNSALKTKKPNRSYSRILEPSNARCLLVAHGLPFLYALTLKCVREQYASTRPLIHKYDDTTGISDSKPDNSRMWKRIENVSTFNRRFAARFAGDREKSIT